MITAVDSNILIDVLEPDPVHGPAAARSLKQCRRDGRIVACEVVWAEVVGRFVRIGDVVAAFARAQIDFDPMKRDAAMAAGVAWDAYRERGGTRSRMIPDFLIGAHALTQADRLLTRDRGFYRSSFSKLRILEPPD